MPGAEWLVMRADTDVASANYNSAESARFGIHVGRIIAFVRLRPGMQRSVQRLGRHTWAAGLGPGAGSVLGSFTPVRHRSPVVTRIVFARLADGGGRR